MPPAFKKTRKKNFNDHSQRLLHTQSGGLIICLLKKFVVVFFVLINFNGLKKMMMIENLENECNQALEDIRENIGTAEAVNIEQKLWKSIQKTHKSNSSVCYSIR